jgi:hypothetical protein
MINRLARAGSGGASLLKFEQDPPRRLELLLSFAVAMAGFTVIILLEPALFSLERGSHFSWVSLHSLAIIDHSRLATGFVGYSCKLGEIGGDGVASFSYDYFNRYAVLFPILSNLFLDFFRESTQLYLLATKQLMNLIYVLTLWLLYFSLRTMRFSRLASLLSIFSVGASPLWLHYRPMFHFDQPGLLGYVVCIYSYAVFIWDPQIRASRTRPITFMVLSLFGCLLGRSFISVFFLAAISAFQQFQKSSVRLRIFCWLTTLLGGASVVAAAAYAAIVESIVNGQAAIPGEGLQQSSVFQSALRRLGLPAAAWPDAQKPQLELSALLTQLVEWLANLIPTWPALLLLLLCLFLLTRIVQGRASLSASPNVIVWSSLLASIAWLVFFRNLIVFHDYTVIFLVPFMAMAAAFVVQFFFQQIRLLMPAARHRFVVTAILSLLLSSIYIDAYLDSVYAWTVSPEFDQPLAMFYRDSDRFNLRSASSLPLAQVQRDSDWVQGSPYAQCVLLDADLIINQDEDVRSISTPPVFPISGEALRTSTFRSKRRLAEGSLKHVFYRSDDYYLR